MRSLRLPNGLSVLTSKTLVRRRRCVPSVESTARRSDPRLSSIAIQAAKYLLLQTTFHLFLTLLVLLVLSTHVLVVLQSVHLGLCSS